MAEASIKGTAGEAAYKICRHTQLWDPYRVLCCTRVWYTPCPSQLSLAQAGGLFWTPRLREYKKHLVCSRLGVLFGLVRMSVVCKTAEWAGPSLNVQAARRRKKNDMNKSPKQHTRMAATAHFMKSCAGFLCSKGGGVITHPPEHLQTPISFWWIWMGAWPPVSCHEPGVHTHILHVTGSRSSLQGCCKQNLISQMQLCFLMHLKELYSSFFFLKKREKPTY